MSPWILITIVAYLLLAINGVMNKFLLSKAVRDPGVYAFYTGTASALVFFLIPFGFHTLPWTYLFMALASGLAFVYALYFYYAAIQQTSISRILPIEGGLVPMFSLGLAYLSGLEHVTFQELVAFGLLVGGSVLMAFKKSEDGGWHVQAWKNASIAALLFAVSFILTKFTYNHTNFISGLVWTRFGIVIGSVSMLLFAKTRQHIFNAPKSTSEKNKILFYSSAALGAAGVLLQSYAISIGSVVIVNALQGVQFAFILVISVILSEFYPRIIKEEITGQILVQKIAAIILISAGLLHL